MSRSAFAVAFTHAVGKPPLHYLTNIRMKRAADLLRVGNLSVKEVSYRVGYESEIAFGRLFKKHFGVTPSEFKRRVDLDGRLDMPDG
jgi:AraC-like DNA-binding protein